MEGFDYHKSCASVCTCVPLSVDVLNAKPDFPTTGSTGSTVRENQGVQKKPQPIIVPTYMYTMSNVLVVRVHVYSLSYLTITRDRNDPLQSNILHLMFQAKHKIS